MLKTLFTPDHERYDGVRPINVYGLRLFYFLMAAFVATDAWTTIIKHQGPWEPVRAVAWCVWAAYPTLSILGLIHPLRMLPIMMFMIFYKSLWLLVVAYPLWRAGTLAGTVVIKNAGSSETTTPRPLTVPIDYHSIPRAR